jgi:hypothetical protein
MTGHSVVSFSPSAAAPSARFAVKRTLRSEQRVILDNLNTHKPRNDRWLRRHPNVHFHFTPTRASWLNQVEITIQFQ